MYIKNILIELYLYGRIIKFQQIICNPSVISTATGSEGGAYWRATSPL